ATPTSRRRRRSLFGFVPVSESSPRPFQSIALISTQEQPMRFVEIDVFGVYVAPISLMLVGAWLITLALRRMANRAGWMQHVWHPALFTFATSVIVPPSGILMVPR